MNKGVILFHRKCIFCLGDDVLSAARRYQGYANPTTFFEHLENHIYLITEWPFECPHPRCSQVLRTTSDFWQHLQDTHGIARYGPRSAKLCNANTVTASGSDTGMYESRAGHALQETSNSCDQDSEASDESTGSFELPESPAGHAIAETSHSCDQDSRASDGSPGSSDSKKPWAGHEDTLFADTVSKSGQHTLIDTDCMMPDHTSPGMTKADLLDSPAIHSLECDKSSPKDSDQHKVVKTTEEVDMDRTSAFGPFLEGILHCAALEQSASPMDVRRDEDVEEKTSPSDDISHGLGGFLGSSQSEVTEGTSMFIQSQLKPDHSDRCQSYLFATKGAIARADSRRPHEDTWTIEAAVVYSPVPCFWVW